MRISIIYIIVKYQYDNFGFVVNIKTIGNVEIKDRCLKLVQIYKKNLNENELFLNAEI